MNSNNPEVALLFALLQGDWYGHGKGYFPTIDPFDYREKLRFELRDAETLFYDQRTEKRLDGAIQYETSHWESGFIRQLETGELELTNAQSGGRSEVMVGKLTSSGDEMQLLFSSIAQTNDGRMIHTTRHFTITPDRLSYQMGMHTTSVEQLTPHLEATLTRINQEHS